MTAPPFETSLMRAFAVLFCGLAAALSLPAIADWDRFDADFDEPARPWQEIEAQLPPPPQAANLIPFEVGGATRNRYYIDYPSVSVGADGVVRYTVVIETGGGARNVSFEGMRCATGERKLYAFGRGDAWSRNRNARWDIIKSRQADGYHRELFAGYFCAGGLGEPDLKRVRHLLKSGGYRPD